MAQAPSKERPNLRMSLRRQGGVGLIEVLVALVIASFALLGFAGLQMASLRYQKVAQFRSLASQYSADMADRVRANVVGAKAGNYVTSSAYSPLATTATCTPDSSSPTAVAATDLCQWRLALAKGIPGGWGHLTGDTTAGYTITVYFKEPNKPKGTDDAADPNCADGTAKDMRCFKTVFLP